MKKIKTIMVLVIIILILVNFICPHYVYAELYDIETAKRVLYNKLAEMKEEEEEDIRNRGAGDDEKRIKEYLVDFFISQKDSYKNQRSALYDVIMKEIAVNITDQNEKTEFLAEVPYYIDEFVINNIGEKASGWDVLINVFNIGGDALAGLLLGTYKLIFIILPGVIIETIVSLIAWIGNQGVPKWVNLDVVIFNKLPLLDINIFDVNKAAGIPINNEQNPLRKIRESVASWYYAIRGLCIALSLLVLIYIGIRMAISNIADDRARYMKMFKDWLVSFILLFVLHYIILFTITLNNEIIRILEEARINSEAELSINLLGFDINTGADIDLQTRLLNEALNPLLIRGYAGAILYLLLCAMTLLFLIVYIKRFITLCFLVIISPIITVTYAIDKADDGKAQALEKWTKEFVFNILIQPFHCIIYLVFLQNIFYVINNTAGVTQIGKAFVAIIMLGFMYKAEDVVKTIFGFETKSLGAAAIIGAAAIRRAQKVGSMASTITNGVNAGKKAGEQASQINQIGTPDGLPSDAANAPTPESPNPNNTPQPQQTPQTPDNKESGSKFRERFKEEAKRNWHTNTGKTARNLAWRAISGAVAYGMTGEGETAYAASSSAGSVKKEIDNLRLAKALDRKKQRTLDAYEDYSRHKGINTKQARLAEARRLLDADLDDLTDPVERNMAGWLQANMAAQTIAEVKDPKKTVMQQLRDFEDGLD